MPQNITKRISISIIASLLLIVLSGCEKDPLFLPLKKRMRGEWRYEKVEFQKLFSFRRENISAEYKDLTIKFSGGDVMEQTSNVANRATIGKWRVRSDFFNAADDGLNDAYVEGHLTNIATGNKTRVEWRELSVRKKVIRFIEFKDGGVYRFKLRKR